MKIFDIIQKKKNGSALNKKEIEFAVKGFTSGDIPDYQMSALLMAICIRGLNKRETAELTLAMAFSGDTVDLSSIPGVKVDKHSTGGVGDKTTLVISPIVASCGVPIAKMSGRGLGHTGGTTDKLESIPGLRTAFDTDEFLGIVKSIGICLAGQSGELAPADKKIYALRDVTATIDNMGLIAASIMSKKIAAGADAILLDVKAGSGAFMKTIDEAKQLAEAMVDIGESLGRRTVALITNMDTPLGNAIGNANEIIEAVEILRGGGPSDLREICIELAAKMLELGGIPDGKTRAVQAISDGSAYGTLKRMVAAQGGDTRYIDDASLFAPSPEVLELRSVCSGYISKMDVEACGKASVLLGAGREKAGESIDYSAGIYLCAKTGDYVKTGDVLARLYSSSRERLSAGAEQYLRAIEFSDIKPDAKPLIYGRIPE